MQPKKEMAGVDSGHDTAPGSDRRIKVVFFQRKKDSSWNYSIEFIFSDVRTRLRTLIDAEVVCSKYYSRGLLKRLYNCWEAFRRQGEVNHVTGDIHYIGFFLNKRKTIHTIHDCVFLEDAQGLKYRVLKYFWLDVPLRRSRFITTVSNATRLEIIRHSGYDPNKIVIIPNAISERFQHHPKAFAQEEPVVLIIGTAPNKNIPRLIEALKGIRCKALVIGRRNAAYEKQLQDNGTAFTYRQELSDDEMLDAYRQADILLFASTYEGFGMPILEAQATGRPVIASHLSSMPEVTGDSACLVDPYDVQSIREGLQKVIADEAYRNELIKKGLDNVKRFNPSLVAQQYMQLYRAIKEN